MFRRGRPLELFTMTALCTALFASSAAATSVHLLPLKSCQSVMTGGDFEDGLEQPQSNRKLSAGGESSESSECTYASTAADGPGLSRGFPQEPPPPAMPTGLESTPPSLIKECETNLNKLATPEDPYAPFEAPALGGCYSRVTTVVLIGVGARVGAELQHAGPNARNYRDKGAWPAGATRSVLHTFGAYADAEIGYGTVEVSPLLGSYQLAYGFLHVRNAQITIEEKTCSPRAPTSMLTLLEDAKHTL